MEVSTKNTKAELLQYIEQQHIKIKELANAKADSQSIAKAREEKQILENANLATTDGMLRGVDNLADDFKVLADEYKNLQAAVEIKKHEVCELDDIDAELLNMEAIHNAKVEYEAACTEATNTLKRNKDAELKRITAEFEEKKAALEKESKEKQRESATLKKRVEEEYQYSLNKAHREQKDKLEAELATMRKNTEAYCADMNANITKQLNDLEEATAALALREQNMSDLEAHAETAFEEGYTKGKAEAGKDFAFEKRGLEAKHEKEEALLKADLKAAENTIKDLEGRVKELNEQLAEVRKNHQALAEKSIEAGAKSTPVFMPMGNYNEQNQGRGK